MARAGETKKKMNKTLALCLGIFAVAGLLGAVAQDDNGIIASIGAAAVPVAYVQTGEVYMSDIQPGTIIPSGTHIKETPTERLQQEYKEALKLVEWNEQYRLWDITKNQFVYFPDNKEYSRGDIQIIDGHFKLASFDYATLPSDVKLYNLE